VNDPTHPYIPTGPLDPTAAAIAAFFREDPGWQALTTRPPAETRAAVRAATPVAGAPQMDSVEDFHIEATDEGPRLRLYRPARAPQAILVWAHGGGFVLGSVDEIDNFARALARVSGCAVVSVDYRLAPEHVFPAAVDDVERAARWVFEHSEALAGAQVPIVLGGDSAGANLATVATRRLHLSAACTIAGNVLAYPSTEGPDAPSLRDFDPPFLAAREVAFFMNLYAPDPAMQRNPDFAPALAPNLDVLPPTLIITAEHDIITGQAEAYGRSLAGHGVDVSVIRHAGMIHGFLTMDAFFTGAAGAAMRQISQFVSGLGRPRPRRRSAP
jgi:acetyl esterase